VALYTEQLKQIYFIRITRYHQCL